MLTFKSFSTSILVTDDFMSFTENDCMFCDEKEIRSPDHSTVVQQAKMTVDKWSLKNCISACLQDRFPRYPWTAQSAHPDFVGSRVYACSVITCHLHFGYNEQGLLPATAVTVRQVWNRHKIRASTDSSRCRRKILLLLMSGIKPSDHEFGTLSTERC